MMQRRSRSFRNNHPIVIIALCFVSILTAGTVLSQTPPPNQPRQMISPVIYDQSFDDPFFRKEVWATTVNSNGKKEKRLQTSRCITEHQIKHTIRFCDAQILTDGSLQFYIHDFTASTVDQLLILIKDGKFTCQYWTAYMVLQSNEGLIWTTRTQKLWLNKKTYRKGDRVKGKIEFECLQEVATAEDGNRFPVSIKIEGLFKPVIK